MSEMPPDLQLRVTSAEREVAAAQLRDATADGRVTFEELESIDSVVLTRPENGKPRILLRGIAKYGLTVLEPNWFDRRKLLKHRAAQQSLPTP